MVILHCGCLLKIHLHTSSFFVTSHSGLNLKFISEKAFSEKGTDNLLVQNNLLLPSTEAVISFILTSFSSSHTFSYLTDFHTLTNDSEEHYPHM